MENWQSEYLQFTLFIFGTIWLVQRGSPESKKLDKAGLESDQEQKVGEHADQSSPLGRATGGLRTFLYSNSLLLVMGAIFLGSWFAQSVTGRTEYNDRAGRARAAGRCRGSTTSARPTSGRRRCRTGSRNSSPWARWSILSVYLRQRGSPESKPVGAPARRDRSRGIGAR